MTTSNKYSHVMSPLRVGPLLLKNRIISAPTTMHSMSNGELYPNEETISFFEERAKSGVAMVTVAGLKVGKDAIDDGEHASWDISQHNHRNKLMELVERVHFYGAKISMELIGIFPDGYTVSDGCCIMSSPPIGREIPKSVMEQYKNDWVEAAQGLVDCGFDAILIHAGHSIPLAQFLSPLTNKRTDEYGGSLDNRCRYLIEILDAIRAKVGKKLMIEVRISGTEYEKGGVELEEGIRIGEKLQGHLDLLQVSAGMCNDKYMTWVHPCGFRPRYPNVFAAEAFKKSGKFNVPIVTLGAIDSLDAAENIIASGKADLVTLARTLIADPEMIHKCLAGKSDDINPCIRCMRCHDSVVYGNHPVCSVNPEFGIGVALRHMIKPVEVTKNVAVIGGGVAGMKAALIASQRGHKVVLFEKSDRLGGMLHKAAYFDFKYYLKDYMNYLIAQIKKSNIKVEYNTEATPQTVKGFDSVIVAIGADPLILPIPGASEVKPAIDLFGHEDKLGSSLIVIGGGQVGCEAAVHFAQRGIKTTIVEMQSSLAPDASKTIRDELMTIIDEEPNVIPVTGAKCQKVTKDSVTFIKDGKEETISADSVLFASGMRSKTAEADAFMRQDFDAVEIGDCVRARTVEWACKEAYYAAMNI